MQADEAVKKARAVASAGPGELHVGYSPTPFAESQYAFWFG
jgi:hypothetical protein